ncbi:glutamate--tRNA ligase family protein [Flavisolibacter ginsenosidimutans]|uniref:tRNA glutamyl-Q synthetase n=1 Tax=Flavisolibacter ginsenosidimutans TaxID=661481 RepID=A0A5B8ULK4_9BACT|nr:glutamate--tRNA ligase family protein [Flavisolibacter ginsenosidimutans]QEC57547.1 tRNA glutamyl-Q synthetase [Flavisolibacter ginsenosidimutans]
MPPDGTFLKTRIAPTPSGYLHAGNAVNFLLTAALAKKHSAKLLLRIDDLDRERYRQAYATDVFQTLRFLNIQCDEGPQSLEEFERHWSQRHRLNLYAAALEKLKETNAVFACTCSRTQSNACTCFQKNLPLDANGASWRLRTNENSVCVRTIDGNETIAHLPAEMKNFIVRKKDGLPAYQLASVVDDLHFGIDFIVRGQDLWPSTLAQQFLARQLGEERFASIRFYHHPLLMHESGEKLSKSAGDTSVKHWRNESQTSAAFFHYLGGLLHAPFPVHNGDDVLKLFGL